MSREYSKAAAMAARGPVVNKYRASASRHLRNQDKRLGRPASGSSVKPSLAEDLGVRKTTYRKRHISRRRRRPLDDARIADADRPRHPFDYTFGLACGGRPHRYSPLAFSGRLGTGIIRSIRREDS